jgi:hypothetical protein
MACALPFITPTDTTSGCGTMTELFRWILSEFPDFEVERMLSAEDANTLRDRYSENSPF